MNVVTGPRAAAVAVALAAATAATLALPAPPAAAADPVIAAAGDIACSPSDPDFNGGAGTSTACRQQATSDLLADHGYAAVLTLGDNQYGATATDFAQVYDPTWGRVKPITHPSAGNHDYDVSGAAGYFGYFGAAAGNPDQGWYSYDVGSWHVVVLNSNCGEVGGCSTGSAQEQWLRQDLASHPTACTLAYWHHPRWTSSGVVSADTEVTPLWQDLYAAGADLVLNGHAHEYERFAPMAPDGSVDTAYGIREFVVGTGGAEADTPAPAAANSQRLAIGQFGVLALTLHSGSYDYAFQPAAGSTLSDAGTGSCHGAPPSAAPSAPTDVDGTPANGSVTVSWAPPADTGSAPIATYTVTASPGGATATVSGSTAAAVVTGLTNGTPYTFTVTATSSSGSSPPSTPSSPLTPHATAAGSGYRAAVLADSPAAYYRLGESGGTATVDGSGLGRDGSYAGGVTLGLAGAAGTDTAAAFDGSTGRARIDDVTPLRLNGPFTIELWAKSCKFVNSWPGLLDKGSAATADGYLIWYSSNGTVHFKRNNFDIATPPGALGCASYTHLAITYDGTTARWYVNGSLVSSKALAYPIDAGDAPVLLGRGDQFGNETLDEVAFYNSALPQSRLAAHISAARDTAPPAPTAPGAPTDVSATAGDGSATVSWTAPSTDGGSAITSYTVRAGNGISTSVGSSARNVTISGLTDGTTYTFTVTATNAVGTGPASAPSNAVTPAGVATTSYAAAVLADNPVGYWRLGETSGTTAADASGHHLTGTYTAGTTLGRPGALTTDGDTAAAFDGRSGSCVVADTAALRLNGSFTIEFWARQKSFANSWPGLVIKGPSASANGYLIWYTSNGTLHFKRNDVDVATPAGALSATAWHAFAVTYDGTTLRWYVDGAQVTSRTVTFPANAGTAPLQFGRGDQYGDEAMDEVAVYATALPANRVSAHYAAATG